MSGNYGGGNAGVRILGETILSWYIRLSSGRSTFHRIKCPESLRKHPITSLRLSWEITRGPEEFIKEGHLRRRDLLDQKYRSEKISNGIAETEDRKLVLKKL